MSFHKKEKQLFWQSLSKKKKILILSLIIGLIFIGLFYGLIKPSIIGYTTYKNMKNSDISSIEKYMETIDDLDSALILANANMSIYSQFNDKLFNNLDSILGDMKDCQSELLNQKVFLEKSKIEYTNEIDDLEQKLKEIEGEISDLKENNDDAIQEIEDEHNESITNLKLYYDTLINNLANNKCCKEKVDNPSINYYIIENNKVICSVEGTFKLGC
jgi:predicted nuclease with TOPRIM domain